MTADPLLRRRLGVAALVLCAVLVGTVPSAMAQTVTATTGAVMGVVSDVTNAVVPGVSVSLSGPALIGAQSAVTDRTGSYHFSAVPSGDYALTFEVAGFQTVIRDGINVGLGFTATVNVEMRPGQVTDRVEVRGASTVIDLAAAAVTTHFDSEELASLPGSRDFFALIANTPGIAMTKVDVGGNGALALQDYTTYGLRAITGMNRNEVEGIRVGSANNASDNYMSDFASFAEIAIKAVGNGAAMPVPGTLSQYVSKSGGNAYHGSMSLGFQNDAMQATNIDGEQIARGLSAGPGLEVRDVNRLKRFQDITADIGGYVKRDKVWGYGAYRTTTVEQRYAWLLDGSATLAATVATGKLTYLLSPGQKLVGYLQYQAFDQSNYFVASTSQPIETSDALPTLRFPVHVWKAEYNGALTNALYVEARVGGYRSDAIFTSKSLAPRVADIGANTVTGGALSQERLITRPQLNGSVSFMKTRWGSHTFRIGGEYLADDVRQPQTRYLSACNCVSTLNNGVPTQVQIVAASNLSQSGLGTLAGYVDDTWRPSGRLTLLLGLRVDRYQPNLAAQQGPDGQTFAAIDPVLTFNNIGPRLGITGDLSGDGKTVLKLHYGRFWVYPGPFFSSTFNPNPPGWSRTYLWTQDANSNGRWDAGEEGALSSVSGGSTSTLIDPGIANTSVDQTTAYIEREVAPGFGVRSGVVLNARRQPYGTVNVSRPLGAYSVAVSVVDPGPDGRLGSPDDGAALTAYQLAPQYLGMAPVNLTTNLPDSDSEYYTWEITATKRQSGRWSLLASFTETWNRESAVGAGSDFTPNALINSDEGQGRFTTWQAKVNGTVRLPRGFVVTPVVRHQSGTPFARTFVRTLNYGTATLKAEPIASNRTPNLTLVDARVEKDFGFGRIRATGFLDVYNILNTNAVQTLTTTSGSAWLRPTVITGPRIMRIGARLDW